MRNLRLPDFDKNRKMTNKKPLYFSQRLLDMMSFWGADFLTKTGIDVRYSTGTMERFDNELQLRNSHLLETVDFQAMAEIIEVQMEEKLFGMDWYDPTCYAVEILDAKCENVEVD